MDARLREGIDLFNQGRFFECHEILELFFQETEEANKPFVEGLVQLAAGFRMFVDFGEIKGPVRMIRQALIRFESYQPNFLQVRVKDLIDALDAWVKAAQAAAGDPSIAKVPKIPLQHFSFFS